MNAYFKGNPVLGLRGPAGPDGSPVGTVISFLGLTAPAGYLVCDGTVHNISDYPALAELFEAQFGAKNHFGGDGTATFAVPDMRNLFLRGYHGEAEEQLSGDVGERQAGTEFNCAYVTEGNKTIMVVTTSNAGSTFPYENPDTEIKTGNGVSAVSASFRSAGNLVRFFTARPVNMAVLYCVKAV